MKIRKFAAALLALVLCLSLSLPAAFAEAQQRVELKNLTVKDEVPPSTTVASLRQLPQPSEFYQLQLILSSQSEALLQIYDQSATNGEFPFNEQIQTELDDL